MIRNPSNANSSDVALHSTHQSMRLIEDSEKEAT